MLKQYEDDAHKRNPQSKGAMDVLILGTRGVPATHGGFETFAEDLAVFLTGRGHVVTVYCQDDEHKEPREDTWNGVHRIHRHGGRGPLGTILFDLRAAWDAMRRPGVILTLGYNTAIFSLMYRLTGRETVMNMDGIEWKRDKWSRWERIWLRLNETAGALLSTHLVADHPRIADHLEGLVARRKITMIPYGADPIDEPLFDLKAPANAQDHTALAAIGLESGQYGLIIARPEPENSLLEMITAWSERKRGRKLAVLGAYRPSASDYHKRVMEAASSEVVFVGAIYDRALVQTLRRHARVYLHGHRVGGTNPSLIESLAAHNAVIAHDNMFNRWVAGQGASYFTDNLSLDTILDSVLEDEVWLATTRNASQLRHAEDFLPSKVLETYETLLSSVTVPEKAGRKVSASRAAARH